MSFDNVMDAIEAIEAFVLSGGGLFSATNTWSASNTFSHATGVTTNTITERTAAAGVTIDGVLSKDTTVTAALILPNVDPGTAPGIHANASQIFITAATNSVYIRPSGSGSNNHMLEHYRAAAGAGLSFWSEAGGSTISLFRSAAGILESDALLLAPATSTARASIRLPHGTAPSSPVNGDVWTTTTGLFVRINGSTIGPLT